jgi:DNA-binding transcriptional LysR family regulator
MEMEALRIFVEVARRGNFAGVARDRGVDPSSVSRAVALLEDELGVRLFQRSTRSVTLTEAGDLYLARVASMVDELDQARDEARTASAGPAGSLRLTASVAFGYVCLVPLLPEFRARYPEVKLELLLTDARLDLVAERVDLAIRLGSRMDTGLVGAKLFDIRYRVCASPAYVEKHGALTEPNDLRKHRCLLSTAPYARPGWLFRDRHGTVQEVQVDGDVVVSNGLTLRACALAGMGPALFTSWLVDGEIAQGRLVDLLPDFQVTPVDYDNAAWLLYPSRAYLPNKVRVMIDFLKQRLR